MPLADPSQNTMSIVAHPDDDLLFMNPDIRSSIEAGGGHTTVFLTAGDAGYGAEHWAERELGIKAAYGDMAGSRIWVDELVQLTDGSREIELHSSHLAAAPEVRVYFLRLPDGNPGGSGYGVTGNQSLAQLWDGDIDRADTVDGHDSFSRIDVIRILDALMEHHGPETVMMQDYQSDHADEEHSDHLHSAQFSHAALALYSHEHEVQAHINYGTQHLPQNVAHPEYVESAENFAYYADHDFTMYYTLSSEGVPMFGDPVDAWLARQYTFDPGEAALDDLAGHADFVVLEETLPDPDAPPPDDGLDYALEGPDAFLFQVNQDTGEISPQDWFVPSASDAWDQNEDHVYEVTRITSGEGVDAPVHEGFEMSVTEAGISWTALDGSSVEPVPDPDPDPVPVPDPDPEPLPDPDPVPPAPDVPVAGLQYSLEGPDAYLFQIDIATGEISPQGWFSPSLADAWDQGENHVYEVTRVADPGSGGDVTREFLEMSVTADGTEWQIAGEPSPEPEDDPSPDPGTGPSADGPGPVPGTGGMASEGVRFELDGPDVFLFDVDGATGLVQTKPWFVPDPDDPWDQGENNVYDLVLVSRNDLTGDSEETPLSFTLDPSGRWEMLSDAGELPPGDSVPPATEESDGVALMDALYQLYFPDFDPSSEDLPEELDGGLM